MHSDSEKSFERVRPLAEKIERSCLQALLKLGFTADDKLLRSSVDARFRFEKDPSNGEQNLVGDWLDEKGFRQGMLIFRADGSFFLEQDIVRPHPRDRKWFVEGIDAWGRETEIKVEPRLLPMPE